MISDNVEICGIVVAILKMARGRNFSMLENQFGTSLSTHISNFGCPEMIPDIEKFLLVSIFKMATTILQKFNIVRFQR
jgi:xanthine/uracil/vitamin C permease (AzgA family)